MKLWAEWTKCLLELRPACTRNRTFLWLSCVITAMAIRPDLLGVTSLIRGLFLDPKMYRCITRHFQSTAIKLNSLATVWIRLVFKLFNPVKEDGFVALVADGIKIPKEGKKMPAVKYLHQESTNNSKPEFIMGHSFQAVSLLVSSSFNQVFAIPLISRISEGLTIDNRKGRTLLEKLVSIVFDVIKAADIKTILVADAYYASKKIIVPLLDQGHHLISRTKKNVVAYESARPVEGKKRRGRPKKYGEKISLRTLFDDTQSFTKTKSPVYGEKDVNILYHHVDLLWRPVGIKMKFVLVIHPTRGKIILICSSLSMDPLTIIKLYSYRFKIEVSFKAAVHTIGTYAYHFWMKPMKPLRRFASDQNINSNDKKYIDTIANKIDTYHRYVQIGCIVQGLIQHLAINHKQVVWQNFKGWLRTMNTQVVPSEAVVAQALKISFPEFLLDTKNDSEFKKFILQRAKYEKIPGLAMAA